MRPSTYQHYEDRYKKERFEPALAAKLAEILRRHGIHESELRQLSSNLDTGLTVQQDILNELRAMRIALEELRSLIKRP